MADAAETEEPTQLVRPKAKLSFRQKLSKSLGLGSSNPTSPVTDSRAEAAAAAPPPPPSAPGPPAPIALANSAPSSVLVAGLVAVDKSAAAVDTSGSAGRSNTRLIRRASTSGIEGGVRVGVSAKPKLEAFGQIESYKKLEKLGEGTYATVFRGISLLNGKMVALKEIRLEHDEGAPCTAIREVSLLKGLKHANIVTLHDIIHTKDSLTLVFEFLERDLKQYMDDVSSVVDMGNVQIFLYQLVRGLQYCHSRKVLHRDLKPQNILLNSMGELKLADFGLARAKSVPIKTYSSEVVTLWYRPPDVLLGSVEYSTPIDIWGVGCIFMEMVSGRPVFPGSTVEDQLLLIWKVLGTPTEVSWEGVSAYPEFRPAQWPLHRPIDLASELPRLDRVGLDLLQQMIRYNPRLRISGLKALQHPYFASLKIPVDLANTKSIFTCPMVVFKKDQLLKAASKDAQKPTKRRASVKF